MHSICLQIFVSSVYIIMFVPVLKSKKISFKNKTKSVGPSIDPWGTPDRTGNSPEVDLHITTHCHLSLRY